VDSPNLQEASGWSDARLLDLINEAQEDICKEARILKKEHYIPLASGVYTYTLPNDFITAERYMSSEGVIPEKSMSDLDAINFAWRIEEGDIIKAIIIDAVNMNTLEVYPKPSESLTYKPFYQWYRIGTEFQLILNDVYGEVASSDANGVSNSDFGTLTSASVTTPGSISTVSSLFGIVTDAFTEEQALAISNGTTVIPMTSDIGIVTDAVPLEYDNNPNLYGGVTDVRQSVGLLGGTFGIVTSVADGEAVVKIRYASLPEPISLMESYLSLADKWKTCVKYYVAGMALLDDNDAKNNEKGVVFMQKYSNEVKRLKGLTSSINPTKSEVRYRGISNRNSNTNGDY
jgi:hypothetical protein